MFYQLEGDIEVTIQQDGKAVKVPINEGEMFLLPAMVPHSPMRSEGSIGLVIECKRTHNEQDGLMWFCDNCNHKLHDVYFELHDIEKDFLPHFKHFYNSEKLRTCENCGTAIATDPRFIDKGKDYES